MSLPVQDVVVTAVAVTCALVALRRIVGAVHQSRPRCASCSNCEAQPTAKPENAPNLIPLLKITRR